MFFLLRDDPLWSLVTLPLANLAPKSSWTLHQSGKYPGSWMIQIFDWISSNLYIILCAWQNSHMSRASLRWGRFSSLIPAETRKVGICPGRYFIRRFYYTFVNIFYDVHMLKHVNSLLKVYLYSQSKPFTKACLDLLIGILLNIISFSMVKPILSAKVSPRKEAKYSFRSIKCSA